MEPAPKDDAEGGALLLAGATTASPLQVEFRRILGGDEEQPFAAVAAAGEDLDEACRRLFAAWLDAARRADPGRHWFHYWTSETLRRELPRDDLVGAAARVRLEIEQRITLGINLRGRSDREFRAAVLQVDAVEAAPSESAALDALRVILQCSSFSAADLPRALALAGLGPARPEPPRTLFALLAGAYHGAASVRHHWPDLVGSEPRE
ncbi:MAG: hypothetical protein H6807_09725 [Planctomycetes bacterium]|nr:hypothetical protein [Planctomycetota bacterium]